MAIINHNACIELHPCFSLLCHAEEDEHVAAIAMIVCHSADEGAFMELCDTDALEVCTRTTRRATLD